MDIVEVDPIIEMILSVVTIYSSLFNDDDSDDEEDSEFLERQLFYLHYRIRTGKNKPNRMEMFVERTITNSTAVEFQSHFRISIQAFEWLYNTIGPELQSARISGRQTIDPRKQLLCVLWLLATPDSYRSVGNRFDMGKCSVFVSFVRVIRAINALAPRIITWPFGNRAAQNEDKFYRMAHIKGVVGTIDGTYVPIKAPMKNPEVYINRKCFYGITLQCICDSSMKFTDCFTGYPSSVSDVRIFRNSDIYKEFLEHPNNYFQDNKFIIGDKAYPIYKWCVPPYIDGGHLTGWQINFNKIHAKTRQIIERALLFALLFGRCRRLKYLDMNRIDLIPATIIAACVLHNICLYHPDHLTDMFEAEGREFMFEAEGREFMFENNNENIENNLNNQDERADVNIAQEGITFRDKLARDLAQNMQIRI